MDVAYRKLHNKCAVEWRDRDVICTTLQSPASHFTHVHALAQLLCDHIATLVLLQATFRISDGNDGHGNLWFAMDGRAGERWSQLREF